MFDNDSIAERRERINRRAYVYDSFKERTHEALAEAVRSAGMVPRVLADDDASREIADALSEYKRRVNDQLRTVIEGDDHPSKPGRRTALRDVLGITQ